MESRVSELSPSRAPLASLRCPYPGCDGEMPSSSPHPELISCSRCHRLSARCTRIGMDGRCPTLNRPLARFCRHCKQPLGPRWAQDAWVADTFTLTRSARMAANGTTPSIASPGGHEGQTRPGVQKGLALGKPETVLSLSQYLPPDPRTGWPMELMEAGGRLWIGGSDGRFLFVEPFADRVQKAGVAEPVVAREQLWPGRPGKLRACSSGSWMLISSANGIKVLNLLALEDPAHGEDRYLTLWEARDGSRLIAGPVLLETLSQSPSPLESQERTAVWVTREPDQSLVLRARSLTHTDEQRSTQRWRLNPQRDTPLSDQEHAFLQRAPFGQRDRVLLGWGKDLYFIDVPGPGRSSLVLKSLFRDAGVVHHPEDLPGAIFVPGQAGGGNASGGETNGLVFLSCEDSAGKRRVYELSVTPDGTATRAPLGDYDGTPFDLAECAGHRGVLCHSGQNLTLCSWLHQMVSAGSSGHLDGMTRGHVYGRLAVCSGITTEGVKRHHFLVLVDLESARFADSLVWPTAAGHPVVLGRYLFNLEDIPPGGGPTDAPHLEPGLQLTRREILVREAPWQQTDTLPG